MLRIQAEALTYDDVSLVPAHSMVLPRDVSLAPDRWNTARIVVNGAHGEHWINGVKVVEYERFTPEFRKLVANSKYHVWPGFGEKHDGYLLLQDHGFPVSFRNIKIRELPPTK